MLRTHAQSAEKTKDRITQTNHNIAGASGNAQILQLQRTIGNQATQRLIAQHGIDVVQRGPSLLIQRETCTVDYGATGETATTNLVRDREAVKTRLRENIDTWTPHLLDRLRDAVSNLFSTAEEVMWWSRFSVNLVVDLLDDTLPKPVGTIIKAFAEAGEHIAQQSIAQARATLAENARRELLSYIDEQIREGEDYVYFFFEEIRNIGNEECGPWLQRAYHSVDEQYPRVNASNYEQVVRLANQLLERVQRQALQERLREEYEDCLRMELYRPGGIPSQEEENQARETCQQRTGYLPGG